MSANLRPSDVAMFEKFRIPPGLLERAGISRVNDYEARQLLGPCSAGDMAGILIPYFEPSSMKNGTRRWYLRIRRDSPEIEHGKPERKYVAPYGDRKHLYFPPIPDLFADAAVPIVLVEAEKSALAITAYAERTGRKLLALALGGVYGWRGKIGINETANGERVPETGPIRDLNICRGGRITYIMLDANAATNFKVQKARKALVQQLRKQGADVQIIDLPQSEGVNGPDDLIAIMGDEAFSVLLTTARSPEKEFVRNEEGKIKTCLSNCLAILRSSPEWEDVLALNAFSLYVVSHKPAPWQSTGGANWTDIDDIVLGDWLTRNGMAVNTRTAAEVAQVVGKENSFHPVRDYLKGLMWDGIPRVDKWLTTYLGAEDTVLNRAIGERWLISAVARIFQPGCQVDHTLLLEGPQGKGKSTALRTLTGDEWFTDHVSDLGSKDSRLELHGKWVIEHSEFDSIRRGEVERVKAFLTARVDNFRPPYGRRSEAVPRSNVFAASTNSDTPLTDASGNRRFWPVRCGEICIADLARDRNQIWAEAYAKYKAGAVWYLDTPELNALAKQAQDERYEPGPWDDEILSWAEDPVQRNERAGVHGESLPIAPFNSKPGRVTVLDVLLHCVGKPMDRISRRDEMEVSRCLKHAGWKRKNLPNGGAEGKRSWFYVPTVPT